MNSHWFCLNGGENCFAARILLQSKPDEIGFVKYSKHTYNKAIEPRGRNSYWNRAQESMTQAVCEPPLYQHPHRTLSFSGDGDWY